RAQSVQIIIYEVSTFVKKKFASMKKWGSSKTTGPYRQESRRNLGGSLNNMGSMRRVDDTPVSGGANGATPPPPQPKAKKAKKARVVQSTGTTAIGVTVVEFVIGRVMLMMLLSVIAGQLLTIDHNYDKWTHQEFLGSLEDSRSSLTRAQTWIQLVEAGCCHEDNSTKAQCRFGFTICDTVAYIDGEYSSYTLRFAITTSLDQYLTSLRQYQDFTGMRHQDVLALRIQMVYVTEEEWELARDWDGLDSAMEIPGVTNPGRSGANISAYDDVQELIMGTYLQDTDHAIHKLHTLRLSELWRIHSRSSPSDDCPNEESVLDSSCPTYMLLNVEHDVHEDIACSLLQTLSLLGIVVLACAAIAFDVQRTLLGPLELLSTVAKMAVGKGKHIGPPMECHSFTGKVEEEPTPMHQMCTIVYRDAQWEFYVNLLESALEGLESTLGLKVLGMKQYLRNLSQWRRELFTISSSLRTSFEDESLTYKEVRQKLGLLMNHGPLPKWVNESVEAHMLMEGLDFILRQGPLKWLKHFSNQATRMEEWAAHRSKTAKIMQYEEKLSVCDLKRLLLFTINKYDLLRPLDMETPQDFMGMSLKQVMEMMREFTYIATSRVLQDHGLDTDVDKLRNVPLMELPTLLEAERLEKTLRGFASAGLEFPADVLSEIRSAEKLRHYAAKEIGIRFMLLRKIKLQYHLILKPLPWWLFEKDLVRLRTKTKQENTMDMREDHWHRQLQQLSTLPIKLPLHACSKMLQTVCMLSKKEVCGMLCASDAIDNVTLPFPVEAREDDGGDKREHLFSTCFFLFATVQAQVEDQLSRVGIKGEVLQDIRVKVSRPLAELLEVSISQLLLNKCLEVGIAVSVSAKQEPDAPDVLDVSNLSDVPCSPGMIPRVSTPR
ncbi:hypothetical protein CYMTET_16956, partial [Cymbomonas tetramitiformis]